MDVSNDAEQQNDSMHRIARKLRNKRLQKVLNLMPEQMYFNSSGNPAFILCSTHMISRHKYVIIVYITVIVIFWLLLIADEQTLFTKLRYTINHATLHKLLLYYLYTLMHLLTH